MAENNADAVIGERIAEVRRQKELRQEDLLALLEARGLPWTRTVLSRIESGQRALKATELYVVADVLGVDSEQLNPETGGLHYWIARQRNRRFAATADAKRSAKTVERAEESLAALLLVKELRSGRTEFIVNGTYRQLAMAVARALFSDEPGRESGTPAERVSEMLGFDKGEVEELFQRAKSRQMPAKDDPDAGLKILDAVYGPLFAKHYPQLKFVGDDSRPLTIEGVDLDLTDGG